MAENAGSIHDKCMEVTAQMMTALIESGKLPTEESASVDKYYADLYRWVYCSRMGKVPESPK